MASGHHAQWGRNVVRRNRHIVRIGNVGNALAFHDATCLGEIGHDHVCGLLLQQFDELEPCVLILAGADHRARRCPDLRECVDVLGRNRLLEPHEAQILDCLAQCDRRRQVELAVAVYGEIDFVPECFPCGLDQIDDVAHLFSARGPVVRVQLAYATVVDIELDRAETLSDDLQRFLGIGLRLVGLAGVTVGIEPDLVSELAAKQFVHGHAECLSSDVIESVLDAGQGKDERSIAGAAVASPPTKCLVYGARVHGVLTNELWSNGKDGLFGGKA